MRTLVIGASIVITDTQPDGADRRRAGGAALETAIGLTRLGHDVEFLTNIAPDDDGMLIVYRALDHNVRIRPASFTAERTPTAGAHDADVAASTRGWVMPALRALAPEEHLHIASLSTLLSPDAHRLLSLMDAARRRGSRVSLDATPDEVAEGDKAQLLTNLVAAVDAATLVHITPATLTSFYPAESTAAALTRMRDRKQLRSVGKTRATTLVLSSHDEWAHTMQHRRLDAAAARGRVVATLIHASGLSTTATPRKRQTRKHLFDHVNGS
ncbi:hypothetical protein MT356_20545 [Rathayibacter festucae]|uniref:hypothetical protein n=1 Tax=Rathayibacter festucae TaxID=110937 RepID=UPI001FB395AC|nr:hypothetical protein [Rathayibacter festucae]MCJ1702107.1 hypothetical protein [Rathayibacter festucae]